LFKLQELNQGLWKRKNTFLVGKILNGF
jgi:hypothetical protein